MRGNSFVDTNIWIHAHLRKPGDPRHDIALQLVETLIDGVISPQVAAEHYAENKTVGHHASAQMA